jgi:hypothetical protein
VAFVSPLAGTSSGCGAHGGGADEMQLAACQRRLEDIGRVQAVALGRPSAHKIVHLHRFVPSQERVTERGGRYIDEGSLKPPKECPSWTVWRFPGADVVSQLSVWGLLSEGTGTLDNWSTGSVN